MARPACAGRAAIRTPGKVRRAEDCPPYQSGCDGARPLKGRSKFWIGRRAFVRVGLRAQLRPAPKIGRRANRPYNCFWFTAQTPSRGGKVGRAVHCAPVWLVQTPAFRFESGFPRPYGRGYGARHSWSKKAPDTINPLLRALRPRWPRDNLPKGAGSR